MKIRWFVWDSEFFFLCAENTWFCGVRLLKLHSIHFKTTFPVYPHFKNSRCLYNSVSTSRVTWAKEKRNWQNERNQGNRKSIYIWWTITITINICSSLSIVIAEKFLSTCRNTFSVRDWKLFLLLIENK